MGQLHWLPRRRGGLRARRGAVLATALAAAVYGFHALGPDSHAAPQAGAGAQSASARLLKASPVTPLSDTDFSPSHYELHATEPAEPIATF